MNSIEFDGTSDSIKWAEEGSPLDTCVESVCKHFMTVDCIDDYLVRLDEDEI